MDYSQATKAVRQLRRVAQVVEAVEEVLSVQVAEHTGSEHLSLRM